jgi:GT2 family glycosyltransferase
VDPRISVVVISRNEGLRLRGTVENLLGTLPPRAEILVVDDGSTDGSSDFLIPSGERHVRLRRTGGIGVAAARNWGAARALGDVIIFADAHIRTKPGWWQPLVELLQQPRAGAASPAIADMREVKSVGYGWTLPKPDLHPRWVNRRPAGPRQALILPGACLAMRRDVFRATGFDGRLRARGGVDNELCLRLWMLGYELWVTPETVVRHQFRKSAPYPVQWAEVLYNRLRLALLHLSAARIARVTRALGRYAELGEALCWLLDAEVAVSRAEMARRRVRDDDWVFERFGLKW